MIKKIVLKNFQQHRNLEIELDPHVTVLVGNTNAGKSTVLRALDWVVFNLPAGDDFRNWDCSDKEETAVTVELDNDIIIKRIRSNKENKYVLKIGKEKAIDLSPDRTRGVPEQIQQILNLKPINFQRQEDPNFLVNDNGGEIAKKLNEVANLELIDIALQRINATYRHHNSELKKHRLELKDKQKELASFDWIDSAEKAVYEVLSLTSKKTQIDFDIAETENSIQNLDKLFEQEQEINIRIETLKAIKKDIESVVDKENELNELSDQINQLIESTEKLEQLDSNQAALIVSVQKQKELVYAFEQLVNCDKEVLRIDTEISDLEQLIKSIESLEQKEFEKTKNIEKQKTLYHELMPDECPLCGQAIPKEGK